MMDGELTGAFTTSVAAWVREALDSVLAGGSVGRPETDAVGCTVKWR